MQAGSFEVEAIVLGVYLRRHPPPCAGLGKEAYALFLRRQGIWSTSQKYQPTTVSMTIGGIWVYLHRHLLQ